MVLAADQFLIEPDGRVKLAPFSIAIFGKDKGNGRCARDQHRPQRLAYLTFDKPVTNLTDMANRKIVGGELVKARTVRPGRTRGVTIVNNRRSTQRDDDVVFTPGPVYYQDDSRIWTKEVVRLTDLESRPPPPVTAIGHGRLPEQGPRAGTTPGTSGRTAQGRRVNGVEPIVLRADVDMHLWVDASSGFLGTAKGLSRQGSVETGEGRAASGRSRSPPQPEPPPPGKKTTEQPEKAQLVIKTQGPFFYDV